MILYLALFLVFLGALFLFSSVNISKGGVEKKDDVDVARYDDYPSPFSEKDEEIVSLHSDAQIEPVSDELEDFLGEVESIDEVKIYPDEKSEDDISLSKDDIAVKNAAVLYEDDMNAIDLSSKEGLEDISFDKLNSLKRLGRGEVSLGEYSLNFLLQGKLFRFDLNRIGNLRAAENLIHFTVKGSQSSYFAMLEDGDELIEKLTSMTAF